MNLKKLVVLFLALILVSAAPVVSAESSWELIDTVTNPEDIELEVVIMHSSDGNTYYFVSALHDDMLTLVYTCTAEDGWVYDQERHMFVNERDNGVINFVIVSQLLLPKPDTSGMHLLKGVHIDDKLYLVIEDHFPGNGEDDEEVWLKIIDSDYDSNYIEYFSIGIGGWKWDNESQTLSLTPEEDTEVAYCFLTEKGELSIGNFIKLTKGVPIVIDPAKAVQPNYHLN